jgi:DNA polymerase-3 subunit delta'
MSRKPAAPQPEDDDGPNPRSTYRLVGHDRALAQAARALRGGRPPQGWLISGPPGIGKATLAWRIARYLLAHGANADGPEDLDVPPDNVVSRQIEAGAPPGLMLLTRGHDEKGKLRSALPVAEVRRLASFFGLTSGAGGWRVAIVDSADDMNDNAANALLKLLEEPPQRAMLLLIAHAPGRLLPTIRSRCQRLDLRPLNDADMANALGLVLPDLDAATRDMLIAVAEGSPGLALKLSDGDGLMLAREAASLIEAARRPDFAALYAMAERVAKAEDGLAEFGRLLAQALARRARAKALAGEGIPARDAEAWEQVGRLFERAGGIHLEPRQTVISAAGVVRSATR